MNEKQLEAYNFVKQLFSEARAGTRKVAHHGIIDIEDSYSRLVQLLIGAGVYAHSDRNEPVLWVTGEGDLSYRHSDRMPEGIEISDATYPQARILFFAFKINQVS